MSATFGAIECTAVVSFDSGDNSLGCTICTICGYDNDDIRLFATAKCLDEESN